MKSEKAKTYRRGKILELFQKCYDFTRADQVKAAGVYPYFRAIEENEGPVVIMQGREVIMAGSNNYLGLTSHPKVKEAARKAIELYGTGCSGSRYLTGTIDLHEKLEERLAKFLGYESCLLFSTGYQTALGVIPCICTKGDYIICDKENHASIMNACISAKAMLVEFKRYKHCDMQDLERILASLPPDAGKLIITDGVFSASGEIANLPEITRLAEKYHARILTDDAHSVGVVGKGGRGTASFYGLTDKVDMTMGTFSKTFASLGGFVCGPERVINYIKHNSSALIFSASPTPASVASALAALEILEAEPERVDRLVENSLKMQDGFANLGFNIICSRTGVVPVIIGDDDKAFAFWKGLFDAGVFVNAFVPPGVPVGMSMMRTSYMATHRDEHLNKILDIFAKVGKDFGYIK